VSHRRILLLLASAPALLVAIAWYWLLHTEPGARWLWSKAESATGGALSAESITGNLGSGVAIQGLGFENATVDIEVDEITLAARLELLPIRVVVERADSSGFNLSILETDGERDGETDLGEIFTRLRLPFEIAVVRLDMDNAVFAGFVAGKFLSFDSATITGRWQDVILIERLQARTQYYDAEGAGRLELSASNEIEADVRLSAKPTLTGLNETLSLDADITGSLDDLRLQAQVADPEADVTGRLGGLGRELTWEVEVRAPALSVPMDGGLAELPPVRLSASARGDTRKLAAEADVDVSGTSMKVGINANVDIESGAIATDVDWQDAHWPVGEPEPQVASRTGRIAVGGLLDDWTVAGTLELVAPQLPPGRFTIDGKGDRDRLAVKIIEGNVLGGTIRGSAEYSWRAPRTFAADIKMSRIRTDAVIPDWPAELSGAVEITGQLEPFNLGAMLRGVSGHFRDRPLSADGRVEYEDGAIGVGDLELRHGDAGVRLDGQLYAASGLAYDVFVDDLALYVDDAFGELQAAGVISLAPGGQYLRMDASGESVGYRETRIDSLRITDGDRKDSVFSAEIAAARLTYNNLQAQELRLAVDLGRQSQSIDLDAFADGLRAGLSLRGALDDWNQPSTWTGEISRLEAQHEDFHSQLVEPAPITLAENRARIDRFCLASTHDVGLCMDGSWVSGDGLDVAATLSSVPVDLVNAFADTRLEFDQFVSGEFNWNTRPDGRSGGRADLRMTAGTISSIDDPERVLTTGQSRLGFDVDGDDLRGGIVDVPLPGQGQIAVEFQVIDVADKGAAALDGRIDVDLADIGIVLPFLPVLDDAGGVLRADIDLDGTLDTPDITGTIVLEGGTLSYLPIGLEVDEIELHSRLRERGEIELTGSFRAGDGRGQIRSHADQRRTLGSGLEVTLRGHNLTVIDVPDVKAIANTDVQINFDGDRLDISGNLSVPRARIVPSNLGTSRVYESEDVVIVAGELQDESTEDVESPDIRILGSLDVSLGKDVVVVFGVVETSVSGSTLLTWRGDPIPMASGRYDVDGEILAFGQRLEITEGSVQFPDVRADDPYLRIRAEREIFGNTQVRRAGVLVAGSVSRPTIEAYTTPITTEERALTLLVTGSDFDYERGVGAVDFGTYIAPRVYASYGIGLFDNENVIRVRYDLKRGFGVTLTSGQKESGADLSYRFEN
jgi:translocation and assembly module TamB